MGILKSWSMITSVPIYRKNFAVYDQLLGRIETHFKIYKFTAFKLPHSRIRDVKALIQIIVLRSAASVIISFAIVVITQKRLQIIDGNIHKGLSFLHIGLRVGLREIINPATIVIPALKRLVYEESSFGNIYACSLIARLIISSAMT